MKIFKIISSNADVEWTFIDASHVRALWTRQQKIIIKKYNNTVKTVKGTKIGKVFAGVEVDQFITSKEGMKYLKPIL